MTRSIWFLVAIQLGASAAVGAERFPLMTRESMTPEQNALAQTMMAGPRRSIGGPYNGWVRSPDLATRLIALGEYTRSQKMFPSRLRLLAALIVAREWDSQYEWNANHVQALEEGLPADALNAIATGRRPDGLKEDEQLVYDFSTELWRDKHVSDETYAEAIKHFGEGGLIDLIGMIGYFDIIGMTLNLTERPLPDGAHPALTPISGEKFPRARAAAAK